MKQEFKYQLSQAFVKDIFRDVEDGSLSFAPLNEICPSEKLKRFRALHLGLPLPRSVNVRTPNGDEIINHPLGPAIMKDGLYCQDTSGKHIRYSLKDGDYSIFAGMTDEQSDKMTYESLSIDPFNVISEKSMKIVVVGRKHHHWSENTEDAFDILSSIWKNTTIDGVVFKCESTVANFSLPEDAPWLFT